MRAAELFELLAATTWRTIHRASRNRISFGEDAITSINLNAIASLNDCVVVEDSRVDEAHKGCDFEMWIGNHANGWKRYAVQAKKMTASTSRYERLKHQVRGRAQIDVLKQYASVVRAMPVYCFYNFSPHVVTWNCRPPRQDEQLGCMVVPATVVEKASRQRGCGNFDWIHTRPEAIPWRCLLTCLPKYGHREYASFGWPKPETFHHDRLPEELAEFSGQPMRIASREPSRLSLEEETLYPQWRVVVNTGGEREGE